LNKHEDTANKQGSRGAMYELCKNSSCMVTSDDISTNRPKKGYTSDKKNQTECENDQSLKH